MYFTSELRSPIPICFWRIDKNISYYAFEEAYEIRYMATDNQNCYQSEPIPILYSKDEHESSKRKLLKSNNIRYMEVFREP